MDYRVPFGAWATLHPRKGIASVVQRKRPGGLY